MKCLVLAGGKGDRLWPLSRKDYPKQFIKIQKNHSIFQETIARNMAFCDEFIIVTNKEYEFIIEDQMKVFQGITYRTIFEEVGRKTTAAIVLACLQFPLSEMMFVVASDHLISGDSYKDNILHAKELAKDGALVTFGMEIKEADTRFGYIRYEREDVIEFVEKPNIQKAVEYMESGSYYINGGMFLFQIGMLFRELEKYSPWVYSSCKAVFYMRKNKGKNTYYSEAALAGVEALPIEKTVFEQTKYGKVVKADFLWKDIGRLEDIEITDATWAGVENQILHQCNNTTVLNRCPRSVVVANQLDDIIVINTKDAVYVGKQGESDSLKEIMRENEQLQSFFKAGREVYRPWGNYEMLKSEVGYQLRRVELNEGKTIYSHIHEKRSEHWSIVSGEAKVVLDGVETICNVGDQIDVTQGMTHQISNIGRGLLVFIEVSIGYFESVDMISVQSEDLSERELGYRMEPFVKLSPVFKDYLWGGNKLREVYHKKCDYDIIAESWEMSAHKAGESIVSSGRYKGSLFGEYLQKLGQESWGWKCQSYEQFPLLVKFIDAKDDLSIQVHPEDNYALEYEHEYGKNEMWYIMEAEEKSGIYYGFRENVTREQVESCLLDGTIETLLNWVPVKKGETYFIPAGTVHAIGKGVMICEIQQSSNSTYRLYDYGRRDKFGNLRELHIEKALDVLDFRKGQVEKFEDEMLETLDYSMQILARCKYFECAKYQVKTCLELDIDNSSFISFICTEGAGSLTICDKTSEFKMGDSIFIPVNVGKEKEELVIKGMCEVILTHV